MKRKLTSILAAFALLCSLAMPALAEGYDVEVSNINGVDDNKFGPQGSMMREQALAIAVRMLDNLTFAQ